MVPVGQRRDAYKLRLVHLTETDHVSHLGTDGKVVSKRIIKMGSDGVERIRLKVISKCIIKNGFRWCGTNSFESNIKMQRKKWVQMVWNEFV